MMHPMHNECTKSGLPGESKYVFNKCIFDIHECLSGLDTNKETPKQMEGDDSEIYYGILLLSVDLDL